MFCGKCGTKNEDGAKFCEGCGSLLEDSLPSKTNKTNKQNKTQNPQVNNNTTPNQQNIKPQNTTEKPKKPNKLVAFLQKNTRNKVIFFGSIGLFAALVIAAIIVFVIIYNQNTERKIQDMLYDSNVAKTGIIPSNFTDESPYHMEDLEITKESDSFTNGKTQKSVEFSAVIVNDFFRTDISGNAIFTTGTDVSFQKQPQVTWSDTTPLKGVTSINYKTSGTTTEKYNFDIVGFSSEIREENNIYKCRAVEAVEFDFGFCVDKANLTQNYKFDKKDGWVEDGKQEFSDKQTVWTLAGKTFAYDKMATNSYGNDVSCKLTFKESTDADTLNADFTIKRSKDKSYSSSNTKSTSYTEYYDINKSGSCSGHVAHKFGEETFEVRLISTDKMVTFNISKPTIKVMENTNEKVNSLYVALSTEIITSKYISPTRTSDGSKYSDSYTVEQQTNQINE